jgi:hypothetical protein
MREPDAPTTGPGPPVSTGFLTEPSSCRPIFVIRRVHVILTASRAVNNHDPFTCCSQSFDRKRGSVHASQARSGGPPGMQFDVDEDGSFDGLADRRSRWGPATGIGGSHDDPPMNETRKGGTERSRLSSFIDRPHSGPVAFPHRGFGAVSFRPSVSTATGRRHSSARPKGQCQTFRPGRDPHHNG